jgi:hypothetical protein
LRAAGFAAAAVTLFAAASSPSLAVDLQGPGEAVYTAHEAAQVEDSDLALNGVEAARPVEVGVAGPVSAVVRHAMAWLGGDADEGPAIMLAPRTLGEMVQAFAADQTADTEQDCLANAVYFEARGEPIEGQLAVAEVVLNRASSGRYPATLCAVITQKAQFSFIRSGGKFPKADRSSEAWRKAVAIAHIAKAKLVTELNPDVLWYHATYVSPSWGRRLTRQTQIGLHIFYS